MPSSNFAFLSGRTLSANRIEFVKLIVNHLIYHGVMDASLLYESPSTDLTFQGPDGIVTSAEVDELTGFPMGSGRQRLRLDK